jgi:hypothetical protein
LISDQSPWLVGSVCLPRFAWLGPRYAVETT